jgi:hypothetical protein
MEDTKRQIGQLAAEEKRLYVSVYGADKGARM